MSVRPAARQRQTLAARQALASRFTTPEERSEHYRALGRKSAADRLVLSGDARAALVEAYALLGRVVGQERSQPDELQTSSSETGDPEIAA
jgi:hypothetical protein